MKFTTLKNRYSKLDKNKRRGQLDWWLFFLTLFLLGFGLLMIYEASSVVGLRNFGDAYHFIREQLKWSLIGIGGMIIIMVLPYKKLRLLALPMLLGTLCLLIGVFLPHIGVEALGARRWINIGFTILQPAEFAKLSLIIYLSSWFSNKEKGRLSSFLLLITLVVGLVILEPDMGTSIVILIIAAILYFISGAPLWHFLVMIPLITTSIFILAITSPYRFNRLIAFFNPTVDPLGISYHVRQVVISLGSGGWFGLGLGKSLQKYDYLPEATTDSIFAIIAEELGFIGALFLICLFIFFLIRGFKVARSAKDVFGRLLSVGIVSWFTIQTLINLSTMTILLPLTGIPLPLISYGGSSLVAVLLGIGMLLNVSRNNSYND